MIESNTVEHFRTHILLTGADHNIISRNNVTRSWDLGDERRYCGIDMYGSSHNLVINNFVGSVAASGIRVFGTSVGNTLQANTVEDVGHAGIQLHHGSSSNELVNNRLSGNAYGIILDGVSDNALRDNALVNNSWSAFDNGDNTWHGNYYGDYAGGDSGGDEVGDSPYLISPSGIDRAPLAEAPEIVAVDTPDLGPASAAPEPSGWLWVNTDEVWVDEILEVEQEIAITDGGSLTIKDSTVRLLHNVWIEEGGSLVLENANLTVDAVDFRFLDVGSGGTLVVLNSRVSGNGQSIGVHENGHVRIENSELYWLGGWDADGAVNIRTSDAIIKDNLIFGSYNGIALDSTAVGSQVVGNTIAGGGEGISFFFAPTTIVRDNVISRMMGAGISGTLIDSTVAENTFQDIWGPSIRLVPASPEQDSVGNSVYENSFINCGAAFDDGVDNVWYSEDKSRGNYWSDYRERYPSAVEHSEHPGIWDTPYTIGTHHQHETKQDIYPLMHAPVLYYRSLEVAAPDTVELIFSQNLYNALASEDELKSAITFAPAAATYKPLGEGDFVSISANKLTITFAEELSGNMNRIRIAAGSLEDGAGMPIDYELRIAEFGFQEEEDLFSLYLPIVCRE